MDVNTKNIREIHNVGAESREWVASSLRTPPFGRPHVRIAGHTFAGRGYRFVRQAPPFAMILVTESGEGEVWVDGAWQPSRAGQAYLTAPGIFHAYHIRPGQTWRVHWIIYWEESTLPNLEPGRPPRLIELEATGLRHAVEGFCHENRTQADPGALELWAALVDRAALRALDTTRGNPHLDRLWLAVNQDIGGTWNLGRMARCAGLSEESVRRLCQRHLGASPMAHLTQLRMQAATDILSHSDEKIGSLAVRLGYADGFSFSTAFKRVLGRSPQRFRADRLKPTV